MIIEQSFVTTYSSEENGIVERANQEGLRHLRALLFDSCVRDKWSFEQLPLVQRIMNTVETTSTGVTPAELILSNSIRLSSSLLDIKDRTNHRKKTIHLHHRGCS